jgi:pyruvate dehydrogenase E1 component alpha subunit
MLLEKLFYQLLRIRLVEERIADEYASQEMRCPVHFCIGHEAIAVGVCANLKRTDYVLSNHRSHGHYLAKGGDLKAMIAEIYGKVTGCSLGRGGSQHLIDLGVNFLGATPIVGGTIPVAVGSAFSSVMKKEKAITAVFFGDAATEEGVFHESLNFASLRKLPVLFVCENNFYSIFTHIRLRQPKRDIGMIASAHGIFSLSGDGNDVFAVYQTAKKAIKHIQSGKGPAFLEFTTYRFREHCGPNYETEKVGRPMGELNLWMKRDPVVRMEKMMLAEKILRKEEIEEMKKKIEKGIDRAFDFTKKSPYLEEEPEEREAYG